MILGYMWASVAPALVPRCQGRLIALTVAVPGKDVGPDDVLCGFPKHARP